MLGFLDGDGPHQRRLAFWVKLSDLFHDGIELFPLGTIDDIRIVHADHGLVRGDDHHVQVVDLGKLGSFSIGRPGHARQFLIKAKIVLKRDGSEGLVFIGDLHPFLGLHGLV